MTSKGINSNRLEELLEKLSGKNPRFFRNDFNRMLESTISELN
jgi:hypothetical protein|tara:strand:- start:405 stop:533 length:129 start_codon:yes stop_codon:yes gene_type:complete